MKNNQTFLGIVVLLLVIVGTFYSLFIRPSSYKFNGGQAQLVPIQNFPLTEDFVDLIVYDGGIYECNKNGLIKKDIEGEMLWSKSYFMDTPSMVQNGNYLAIGDITGKSVYVFNTDGFIREVKESYQIIDIHINQEGFLTTVQEKGRQNFIKYYNAKGFNVIERATAFIDNGYPIDVTTSLDVQKMLTGYLNVSSNRLQTHISFFGFEDKYDELDENLIGGFVYENSLVNQVLWISEDRALVVMDNALVFYDCKELPQVVNMLPVLAEIKNVQVSDEEVIVQFGKATEVNGEDVEGKVLLYDHDGNVLSNMEFDEDVQLIKASGDAYFVITDSMIIKYMGKSREWFSNTYLTIEDFYEVDKSRYVALTSSGYEVLKMKER